MIDVIYVLLYGVRSDFRRLWGTDDLHFLSRYDGLLRFRLTPLGAFCLGRTDGCESASLHVRSVLKVLPDLEVAATGPLDPADVLALDAFARKTSEGLWRLETGPLLEAIAAGHRPSEFIDFLKARSGEEIPPAVRRFLSEVEDRSKALRDAGPARLIECADPFTASLIARDPRAGCSCILAGDRHLVVPASSEAAFRRALKAMGQVILPLGGADDRGEVRTEE